MSSKLTISSKESIVKNLDRSGQALAQVIHCQSNNDVILGQAWLAGSNRLITCGHVVDKFIASPKDLFVYFPATGNKYPILQIRLHPSFVRQPDGLVKFDVALLTVSLSLPESNVEPLPFCFERVLRLDQTLTVIRYPIHLGQISAAQQPLAQKGKFLGYLRKHDNFHLLHDLALSAGDSGAPICDQEVVVAIHCGDTATLPGLNLPTTSIRLALWIDSLRELGISQTKYLASDKSKPIAVWFLAMLLSGLISFIALVAFYWQSNNWQLNEPYILPAMVKFNRPIHGYKLNEDVSAEIKAQSESYLYLFSLNPKTKEVLALYPPFGYSALVRANDGKIISQFGHTKLTADPEPGQWILVAIEPHHKEIADELLKASDWANEDFAQKPPLISSRNDKPLVITSDVLIDRIRKLNEANRGFMWHAVIDAPTSTH